ncbi:hypothetical protein ZIOFF_055351 [Zingiber officinale]|uniref:Zinc-finger domain-containing protein n=1 Tax=Zingiber officinale TaxID=94328 RepID=A0A8J5KNF8_ZINOF|nr:hypothetical protein ZIOFF_055351 [Zingiber officinale]
MLLSLAMVLAIKRRSARLRRSISYAYHALSRYNIRSININEMAFDSDRQCIDNCRMDRRVLKRQTARSGETISMQFHLVLNSILRLHNILLKKPEPIPENCTDDRKGEIATNVLDVCTPNMQFSYVLPGWEESAADGRVLRDAIDAALVDCLVELSKDSAWKSKNGFRTGYLVHLEKLMAAKLSSSSLKATPHIESRYKLLKRQFYAIIEMLNHIVDLGGMMLRSVLLQQKMSLMIGLSHPAAIGLRNKEFPHLDDLMFVWGKDHATGANAKTPADAVEEINLCDEEVDTSNAEIFAECYKGEESNDANQAIRKSETLDSSICPSNKKPTTKKRKGKADDDLDDLVGEIHKYVIAVTKDNEEMKGISTYFKKQTDSGDRKMKIYDELIELSKFSEQEIMDVLVLVWIYLYLRGKFCGNCLFTRYGENILETSKNPNWIVTMHTQQLVLVLRNLLNDDMNSDEHSAKNVAVKKANKSLEDVNPVIDSIASRLRKRNIG